METSNDLEEYRNNYTNKHNYYHDNSFYKWQRKRLQLLIKNNKPIGDKWSFDKENRKPYEKNYKKNEIVIYNNSYITEAKSYI